MLVSVTPEGIITQWNTATERHTGIQASDAIDTGVWGALPFFKPYMDVLNTVVQTGKPVDLPRQKVSAFEERYLSISIAPLTYDQTSGAVILIDDVTEMAMKDAQLIQAQKMETVGNLAGGLAHDFNNVLGGIIGTISLMRYSDAHKSMNSEKFSSRIDLIERSANRAVDLVQQLLALSKKQELSLAPVDLNLSTKHVLKICQNTFDKSIVIEAEYFPEPAVIMADPAQVEQVLLNLCVNASHAMTIMRGGQEEPGGTLSLTIKRIHADHYFCSTHPEAKTGHYWVLNVRDTGVGMEARTIAKIFDPFFTTKEIGTGLGLAMVSNIIQQHDGFLDIYSEFGSGTSFNLFFPEQEGVTAGAEVVKTDEFLHLGSGTILVVEDDEIIRKTASTMLEECGYEVITATDGKAAVFVFEKRHHEIKGVLMDMAMPRMSGKEAYIRMKKIAPGIKVLLTSGFKQDQRVQDVFEMGVDGFIQKPYSMPDLIKKVREVFE
ncbi:MAG: response regulator, partial [Thermodesulfobacteriota bacterium]|nr:response regulator [Thermodesulfobacteriota bacterium]